MGNGAKNGWWFLEKFIILYWRKSEKDTGSAEEQPASDKIYHEEWSLDLTIKAFFILCVDGLKTFC